ncbi:UNVERIFIED_CONTAM: hypothetical protein Sangu_1929700 [Sesamum angustifolium]|uniref:Uncharacterized protein n=1 Tax=Sesamum angustifolium TaxID=2727405 RepID=A0AAW2LV61_9LAMI
MDDHIRQYGERVRLISKAAPDYSLAVQASAAIVAHTDPNDTSQEWVKDKKYSDQVKDQVGNPGFSLVNVVTGQALRHAPAAREPVQMVPYNRDVLDINFMWSESHDLGMVTGQ